MSKTQDAVDYLYANPHYNCSSVAKKFNMAASNLYVAIQRHNSDIAEFETVGPERLAHIDAWMSTNEGVNLHDAAINFGMMPSVLRAAQRGRQTKARKARLAAGLTGALHTLTGEEMREACAVMCETLGGDMAATYASTIRSLPLIK